MKTTLIAIGCAALVVGAFIGLLEIGYARGVKSGRLQMARVCFDVLDRMGQQYNTNLAPDGGIQQERIDQ